MILMWTMSILPVFAQDNPSFDWKSFDESWKSYASDPSDENARKVYNLLPPTGFVPNAAADGTAVVDEILRTFQVLEGKIADKNRDAVRLGFRLVAVATGALANALNRSLGNFVGFDPRMFLEELGSHRDLFPSLEPLLGSFRVDDTMDATGRELERKYRINVLDGVEDKSLKPLKDECVKILKKIKIKK
jgi:hypothetical protein